MFDFKEFTDLSDGEIKLVVKSHDEEEGFAPRYGFSIIHIADDEDIGVVFFSVDNTNRQYIRGHLSYGVSPVYSGHNYAVKACKSIFMEKENSKVEIGDGGFVDWMQKMTGNKKERCLLSGIGLDRLLILLYSAIKIKYIN